MGERDARPSAGVVGDDAEERDGTSAVRESSRPAPATQSDALGATLASRSEPPPRGPSTAGTLDAVTAVAPAPGSFEGRLADRYRFVRELGIGGMGRVLLVEDTQLGRRVAIKTLLHAESEKQQARFLEEARSTAQLEHPSIVPVYDMERGESAEPYFSMRFVQGRSLADVVTGLRAGDAETVAAHGGAELLLVFLKVCDAVAYAHSRGVLHRDLKPDNIMLGRFGEVFVMDWGLARVGDVELPSVPTVAEGRVSSVRDSGEMLLTQAGAILGTPGYMSPEQARGDRDGIDERSDVFALGAILYEVLAYQPAIEGETIISRLANTMLRTPVPPRLRAPGRAISPGLEAIVLRAMKREKSERFQSVRALRDAVAVELEASQEAARRRERAEQKLASARDCLERHARLRADHEGRELALAISKRELAPTDERLDERREIWRREAEANGVRAAARHAFWEAYGELVASVQDDPTFDEARHALVDLLLERARELREAGDRDAAADMIAIARQHDDARVSGAVDAPARVVLATRPEGARAVIARFEEEGPLLVERPFTVHEQTPVELRLPPGSYIVDVTHPGRPPIRVPVCVGPGEERSYDVWIPPEGAVAPGFVYIPGGRYVVGGDLLAPGAGPRRTVEIEGFAIAKHLVTMSEYAGFLNSLPSDEAVKRATRVGDVPYWLPDTDGAYRVPWTDRDGDAFEADMPIIAISAEDADAYAAWMADQTGYPIRLPTSDEWEAAARGADERIYPWGNGFDPSLCWMRESHTGPPTIRVGTKPLDRSVYGWLDVVGLARQSTTSLHGEHRILRGGAWQADAVQSRVGRVGWEYATISLATLSFRVAHSLRSSTAECR